MWLVGPACAAQLDKRSPEYQQLLSMGYDLAPHPEVNATVARLGDVMVVLDFDSATQKLEATRYFKLRSEFKAPEIELYKLINEFNRTSTFKWFVYNGFLFVYTTHIGPYNPKALSLLMSGMDKLDGKLILYINEISKFAE